MRLDKIKLSGFKSFVDPTTINFPSHLVSLLGPNGCGKSNVIDAVRWVMGESSAKNLRGESLTDVIFNGSASRKPVAQASVELIFDNSVAKLQGEYAKYNEVSVKRVLNRDGQSTFFLNKTRCRRKDITDLFLGTGLGPRSYSIIEQGMISRLIEAKPEEVRVYIEEAAGISKYKERRRETENRIKHSRENIERLDDIRHELETQLNRLQRQARTAKRYQELKRIERLKKAQLHALRWRQIEAKASEKNTLIKAQELQFEQYQITAETLVNQIDSSREELSTVQDEFNQVQGKFYQFESAISRLETAITHQKEKTVQQQQELKQAEQAQHQTAHHVQKDEQQLALLVHQIENIEPQFEMAEQSAMASEESQQEAEEKLNHWQHQWDELMQTMLEPSQTAQIERTKLTHIEQSIVQYNQRQQKLDKELEELTVDETKELVKQLSEEVELISEQLLEQQLSIDTVKQTHEQSSELYQQTNRQINELKHQQQRLVGKQSSLEHLQEAALHQDNDKSSQWISDNGLLQYQQLIQSIRVETEYEHLIEYALSEYLQAYCLNDTDFEQMLDSLSNQSISEFTLCLFKQNAIDDVEDNKSLDGLINLSSVVRGEASQLGFLKHCYIVENIAQAKSFQPMLSSYQTIMTKDGYVLGKNWLKTQKSNQQQQGMIHREKELKTITIELAELIQDIAIKEEVLIEQKEIQLELKEKEKLLSAEIKTRQNDFNQKNNILHSKQLYIEQTEQRAQRIQRELEELIQQHRQAQENEKESTENLHLALEQLDSQSKEKDSLSIQKDLLRNRVDESRQQARRDKDEKHALEIKLNRLQSDYQSMKKDVERLNQQLQRQKARYQDLKSSLEIDNDPCEALNEELQQSLSDKQVVTQSLTDLRLKVESIENTIRDLDKDRLRNEHDLNDLRDKLEQSRLTYQELLVKQENQNNLINETEFTLEQLFLQIPEQANETDWLSSLTELEQKIKNLGNINLAAIDEYKEQSERKTFLDKQNEDLLEALETLEKAIAKIDRETRSRFKATFDTVNTKLQELFPKLFGGGRAYLDLTGDDLLSTGVTIMAQPPGKRNNSIHLLSGGEKAMTAVALVFAIFYLNPSPFCMLDEVDAPLDEANVGRFCSMVKEMSETIQFIFITHNKTSMEISDYLCGVTMKEPGVSRIVDVNLQEATDLVA